MNFRTDISPQAADFKIGYDTPTLGIGSCFIENIGGRLAERQLPFIESPFGIVYNPLSMAAQLDIILSENQLLESDFFEINGLWHSWWHHGKFAQTSQSAALDLANTVLGIRQSFAKTMKRLMLTFGTAQVFELKTTGQIVSNCHKAPPQYFEKKRATVDQIIEIWMPVFEKLFAQNADCQVIISVSPIRHLREGLIENNRSKAILLLATEVLCQRFPQNIHYFPAYELVMDDLRDYRFYAKDLTHPNDLAVDYIWDFFGKTYFAQNTKDIIAEVEKVNTMLAHRPLHGSDTEGYKKFKKSLQQRISELEKKYNFLNFDFQD